MDDHGHQDCIDIYTIAAASFPGRKSYSLPHVTKNAGAEQSRVVLQAHAKARAGGGVDFVIRYTLIVIRLIVTR